MRETPNPSYTDTGNRRFNVNGMIELSALDKRIIAALQVRGNISHAELAEEVAASPASCWRRIKALEAAGVLGAVVRLVNATTIGRDLTAICQVRMKEHALELRASFEEFVRSQGEIMECYSMSGEWDYLIKIAARSVPDYEKFLMQKLLNHPAIATSATQFALGRVKFTTAYAIKD